MMLCRVHCFKPNSSLILFCQITLSLKGIWLLKYKKLRLFNHKNRVDLGRGSNFNNKIIFD